jgi:hypothetical protein
MDGVKFGQVTSHIEYRSSKVEITSNNKRLRSESFAAESKKDAPKKKKGLFGLGFFGL